MLLQFQLKTSKAKKHESIKGKKPWIIADLETMMAGIYIVVSFPLFAFFRWLESANPVSI